MTDYRAVAMDDDEIDEFLGRGGAGVLSLAKEGDSYAVPVSYGYDDSVGHFFFRLGFDPASTKRDYVDSTGQATFVVSEETDEGWKSVVARGRLHEVTEAALDSQVVDAIHRTTIPFVTIFENPARDLDWTLYRFAVDTLSGRTEASPE